MSLSALVLLAVCGSFAAPVVRGELMLEPLSTLYVPYAYAGNTGLYDIDAAAVEQSAYDKVERILYAAGDNFIHIVDLADPTSPVIIDKFIPPHRINDIELCGAYVAYVIEGATSQSNGYLVVRGKYDTHTQTWLEYNYIEVGSKPDMLQFSHDCSFILTANEGEAGESPDGSAFLDPEGSVSIVRGFTSLSPSTATIDFTQFNSRREEYELKGVRAPYRGQLNEGWSTFSQNMEPEYIALSEDDRTAYICLQENNAIAVLDVEGAQIVELLPLGRKDWSTLDIDASDKDGKIATKIFDIYSFYQPDAIKLYRHNGRDYLITANEGDRLEYVFGNTEWDEVKRGESLHDDNDLSDDMSSVLKDDMNDDDRLGRLQFSKYDGLDSKGDILQPHFFGARGVSIFRAGTESMEREWDSADEVERKIAEFYPEVFNGNTKPKDKMTDSPQSLQDTRSDNLGPECESIEDGTIQGVDYAFVGIDRTAAIVIYRINTAGEAPVLEFDSVHRAGGTAAPFQELLDSRDLGDLDPEDIKFVAAEDSVTGLPLLIVTGTVSGTISVYNVHQIN